MSQTSRPKTPAHTLRAQGTVAMMRALEPRIMFDAALAATAVDAVNSVNVPHAPLPPAAETVHEVVFVSSQVDNANTLIAALRTDVEVVALDSARNGLEQIGDYLATHAGVTAVHIVSHGREGAVELGNIWLSSDNLGAYTDTLAAIGGALVPGGDILLYGCNLGAGTSGAALLDQLAQATGADVAASDNPTGSKQFGGDWTLESQRGLITTSIAFQEAALSSYVGLLAVSNQNFDATGFVFQGGVNSITVGTWTFDASLSSDFAVVDSNDQTVNLNAAGGRSLVWNIGGSNVSSFSFKSADGTNFDLNSFMFGSGSGSSTDLTITGWRDGIQVVSGEAVDLTINDAAGNIIYSGAATTPGGSFGLLSFGTAYDNVDEITLDFNAPATAEIDNIDISPLNTAPVIDHVNGDSVAWAGAWGAVMLDAGANVSVSDAELDAFNSGNGDWGGASLTVQRDTAVASDNFGVASTGLFSVSGGNLQSGGLTFGTFTNTGGVLTVNFTSSGTAATTSLVNEVVSHISYRNDTPAGDATVRFTLNDGVVDATVANVTVTSDSIYVTNAADTSIVNVSNGVSFSEALAIAASDVTGTQTIVIDGSLAGQTVSTAFATSLGENLTLDLDAASGATLAGGILSIDTSCSLTLTNGSLDEANIATFLSGTGSVSKVGAGTVTLSGLNSFTGNVVIDEGNLAVMGGDAISGSSDVLVGSGATLALLSNEAIGNISGAGNIFLGNNTLTTMLTADTTFAGSIDGAGGLTVDQFNEPTYALTLTGSNNYAGATTLSHYARLKLDGDASVSDSSQVLVNDNSVLTLLSDQTVGSLESDSGNASIQLGAYTLTAGGDNSSSAYVAGLISGSGSLVKQGSGSLSLENEGNSYSGGTTVLAGSLSILSDGNLGAGNLTLAQGATLDVLGSGTIDNAVMLMGDATIDNSLDVTLSGAVSGNYSLTKTGSAVLILSGDNSYGGSKVSAGTLSVDSYANLGSGDITLAGGSTLAVTGLTQISNAVVLTGNATISVLADATVSGAISGFYSLTKSGDAVLTLSNDNSFGATTVSAGTLSVGSDAHLGSGDITLAGGSALAVTGETTIDNAFVLHGSATISTWASATLSGNITGEGGFVKSGSATLTLSGTNSYTGATVVDNSTLLVNGSLSATSLTTVGSGATLGGSGSITNNVEVFNGGTLSPGSTSSSVGIVTVNGNLVMSAESTLVLDINGATAGTGYDQVVVNGTVDISGASLSVTHNYSATYGDTYSLVVNNAADAVTGTFSGLSEGANILAAGDGTLLTASYIGNTGNDIVLSGPAAPYVTSITAATADGTYKIGDTIDIAVNFSEVVYLSTGTLELTLETGITDRPVSYMSGSGTSTLYFRYTVQAGDNTQDLDYVSTSGLNANGDTIQGGSFIDADLALASPGAVGSLGANQALVIDGLRPTASIVVADTALSIGETSSVVITFSEGVTGLGVADLTVANGTLGSFTSPDGITWTATFTPTASISDTSNLITLDNTGVADIAGNVGSGTTDSNNYAIDTQRPTATIGVADSALSIGETSSVVITFNEGVMGLTTADFTVANGALSNLSSSDGGMTWSATLTPSNSVTDTSNLITLDNTGVADIAGNVGSGTTDSNNYAIDTQRPTATIGVADSALSIGETSSVVITFNEAVMGLTTADFTVANGALSGLSTSDGGITWTATLTPSSSVTDTSNLITLDNTGIADLAGNVGSGTTDSNNYAIDTQRPAASIVVADSALSIGETSSVVIAFNEAVTGLTTADFTVANGALSGLSTTDGGVTWSATLTPTANISDTSNLITLDNTGVADLAGNVGSGTTDSNNYAIDTQRPTASIVVANAVLVAGETTTVTITFSEAVTGLSTDDFTVANGVLSGLSSSDGGVTWTATLTPALSVTNTSNLVLLDNTGVLDASGNTGSGTTASGNYLVDTSIPFLASAASNNFSTNVSAPLSATQPVLFEPTPPIVLAALDTSLSAEPLSAWAHYSPASPLTIGSLLAGPAWGNWDSGDRDGAAATSASFVSADPRLAEGLRSVPNLGAHSLLKDQPFSFTLPRGTFVLKDASAAVSVDARLSDGRPLASWLRFDAATGTLSGQPPAGWTGAIELLLVAQDDKGHRASTVIEFKVKPAPERAADAGQPELIRVAAQADAAAPLQDLAAQGGQTPTHDAASAGRAPLNAQLAQFGHAARHAQGQALLAHFQAAAQQR